MAPSQRSRSPSRAYSPTSSPRCTNGLRRYAQSRSESFCDDGRPAQDLVLLRQVAHPRALVLAVVRRPPREQRLRARGVQPRRPVERGEGLPRVALELAVAQVEVRLPVVGIGAAGQVGARGELRLRGGGKRDRGDERQEQGADGQSEHRGGRGRADEERMDARNDNGAPRERSTRTLRAAASAPARARGENPEECRVHSVCACLGTCCARAV